MARTRYGAGSADYAVDAATGLPVAGFTFDVYTAETGGTHETDLLDSSGSAATAVITDSFGGFRFSGKDGYSGGYWLVGAGGTRYLVNPSDMANRLAAAEVILAAVSQDLIDAVNEAIASAADNTASSLQQHINNNDPHDAAAYPRMRGTAAGANIWGAASVLPGPADGVVDGDYTFLGA